MGILSKLLGGLSGGVISTSGSVTAGNIPKFSSPTVIADSGKAFSIDGTLASNSDLNIPTEKAVKTYADALVLGLLSDRGNFDASGGGYPTTGGTGTAGAILKGNTWKVSVAGGLMSKNDWVRALTDSPGQTATNWAISEGTDANGNESANNFLVGYATTATAAATTTLVVGSTRKQYFTGSTTQTCKLPVTSTLALGQEFEIVNTSSGAVTVQSSGSNSLQVMTANTRLVATCISLSGTDTTSWDWTYEPVQASAIAALLAGITTTATRALLVATDTILSGFSMVNNIIAAIALRWGATTTATAAGTTTLTSASNRFQQFTGSTTQTVVLPDASTLLVGDSFDIANSSSGIVTVNYNGGSLALAILASNRSRFVVIVASSGAGTWDVQPLLAPLASPAFTGNPTAPTQSANDNSTKLATTAYADGQSSNASVIAKVLTGITTTATRALLIATDTILSGFSMVNKIIADLALRWGATTTATAAATTTLTAASNRFQRFTGVTTQTVVLPDASTLLVGDFFTVANRSTGIVTVNYNGGSLALTLPAGLEATFEVIVASSGAGTWDVSSLPSDANLITTDVTTNDVSSSKHGFAPKGDGTTTKFLNANGAYSTPAAGGGFTSVVTQVFAADGTYTPTSGMVYCDVITVGGGGGGGGSAGSGVTAGIGGAGGGGGYARKILSAATIGASKAVAIGAAGSAGSAGNNAGGNGGSTTLGSTLVVAAGGTGGSGSAGAGGTNSAAGGAGGAATTGDVLIPGQAGSNGIYVNAACLIAGAGGDSGGGMGCGAAALTTGIGTSTTTGAVGSGYGGGGGGGLTYTSSNVAGGAGKAGYMIITEYIA